MTEHYTTFVRDASKMLGRSKASVHMIDGKRKVDLASQNCDVPENVPSSSPVGLANIRPSPSTTSAHIFASTAPRSLHPSPDMEISTTNPACWKRASPTTMALLVSSSSSQGSSPSDSLDGLVAEKRGQSNAPMYATDFYVCEWLDDAGHKCGDIIDKTDVDMRAHLIMHLPDRTKARASKTRITCGWRGCQGHGSAQPAQMTYDSVHRHIKTVHLKMETEPCEKCGRCFDRGFSRVRHERTCCRCRKCGRVCISLIMFEEHEWVCGGPDAVGSLEKQKRMEVGEQANNS
jgi:hypothetical protein